MRAFEVSLF